MNTKNQNTVANRLYFGCYFALAVVLVPFQQLIAYLLGNDLLSFWGWVGAYLSSIVWIVAIGWGHEWRERRKRAAQADSARTGLC